MNAPAKIDRPVVLSNDKPLNLMDKGFQQDKFTYYAYLRENLPVHQGRIAVMKIFLTANYDDCLTVVKDPRFGRNRATITGGSRTPFPLPKSIRFLSEMMITEDDPNHRRLRSLVQKAFAPKALAGIEENVRSLSMELLDKAKSRGEFDLQRDYALPIPVSVISQMVGVENEDMPRFQHCMRVLSEGLSGWSVARTLVWDMPKTVKLVRELIEKKRGNLGDDILSGLLTAKSDEDGQGLTEDEIVSMVFLLIIAGFETTVHLISNSMLTLLTHPEQLQRLQDDRSMIGSAVEELLRFCGPIHGTKFNYAREDVELSGVVIPKGQPVMPLLASANRDEKVFSSPDTLDLTRDPNKHLSFSQGSHFCLGAFLARMETHVALDTLVEHAPTLALAVPERELELQRLPGWHRYLGMPVRT